MKLLDVFLRGRRRFDEQVESLFADFDYEDESAKIDILLGESDLEGVRARVANLLRQWVPTDYLCDRAGCNGIYQRRKGRRGPFLGCSNYPKCRSTKDAPPLDTPYERRAAWMMLADLAPDLKRWREFERSRRKARRQLRYILLSRDALR